MADAICNCECGCTKPYERFVECANGMGHERTQILLHAACAKALGNKLVALIEGDEGTGKAGALEGVHLHGYCSLQCARTAVQQECDRDHPKALLTALRRAKAVLRRARWEEESGTYFLTPKRRRSSGGDSIAATGEAAVERARTADPQVSRAQEPPAPGEAITPETPPSPPPASDAAHINVEGSAGQAAPTSQLLAPATQAQGDERPVKKQRTRQSTIHKGKLQKPDKGDGIKAGESSQVPPTARPDPAGGSRAPLGQGEWTAEGLTEMRAESMRESEAPQLYLTGEAMLTHVGMQRDNMVLLGSTEDNRRYTALLGRISTYAFKGSLRTINHRPPLILQTRSYVVDRVEMLRQMYNPSALKPAVVVVEDDPQRQGYPTGEITPACAANIRKLRKQCREGDANGLGQALTLGLASDLYAFTLTGNHSTEAAVQLLETGQDIPPTREAYVFLRSSLSDDDFAFISVYENTLAQEEAGATSLYRDYASPINLVKLIRRHYEDMNKPTMAERAARDTGKTFATRLDRMESPRNAPGENDQMTELKRQERHAVLVAFDKTKCAIDAEIMSPEADLLVCQRKLAEVGSPKGRRLCTVRDSRKVSLGSVAWVPIVCEGDHTALNRLHPYGGRFHRCPRIADGGDNGAGRDPLCTAAFSHGLFLTQCRYAGTGRPSAKRGQCPLVGEGQTR